MAHVTHFAVMMGADGHAPPSPLIAARGGVDGEGFHKSAVGNSGQGTVHIVENGLKVAIFVAKGVNALAALEHAQPRRFLMTHNDS